MPNLAAHHNRPYKSDLAPREREVLRHVAKGLRNKEIAAKLGITERTVENHIENACIWLGCRSRMQAVLRAGIVKVKGPDHG